MAMSRALGGTSLTTRPPMAMSPLEMFSSPAIMRSSVDLPQPEGPTRMTNSPSSISTETPCRISVAPNALRTFLMETLAMVLSFPPAAAQNLEIRVSLPVMNSSSTGLPALVCSMPRLIAGMISSGVVTRSP